MMSVGERRMAWWRNLARLVAGASLLLVFLTPTLRHHHHHKHPKTTSSSPASESRHICQFFDEDFIATPPRRIATIAKLVVVDVYALHPQTSPRITIVLRCSIPRGPPLLSFSGPF